MRKDIKKREDLIGCKVIYDNKAIFISEAWEWMFHNPNIIAWHGVKMYSFVGFYDIKVNDKGEEYCKYARFDVLKIEAKFISEDTS